MEIAIFAEGKSDCAVLQNILMGVLGKEVYDDILFKRPEFDRDETDLHNKDVAADDFSNWTLVKEDCVENRVQEHLDSPFDDDVFAIIQIDTAECGDSNYEVERPVKNQDYCTILRKNVIDKMNEWLDMPPSIVSKEEDNAEERDEINYQDCVFYAICIEEIDAWVLALYQRNTHNTIDPKKKLERYFGADKNRKKAFDKVKNKKAFEKWIFLSSDFQKKKKRETALKNNPSLKDFVESLEPLKEFYNSNIP